MNKQPLLDLGLSKNEVEVYLTLLRLGHTTVTNIAKESKIHRSNVYDALNSLSRKSLISCVVKDETKYYEVIDPEQLLTFYKVKESAIKTLIPELKATQLLSQPQTTTTIVEGIAGARSALTKVIENTKEFFVVGVPKNYVNLIGEGWVNEWHEKRIKNKVWIHHLINHDYEKKRLDLLKKMKYCSIKKLPKEYGTPNISIAYDEGVVLGFTKPLITITIKNPDLVKTYKNYFKMLDKIIE